MASRAVAASLSGAIRAQPALRARGNTRRSARHAVRPASRRARSPRGTPRALAAPDFAAFFRNTEPRTRGFGDWRSFCVTFPRVFTKKSVPPPPSADARVSLSIPPERLAHTGTHARRRARRRLALRARRRIRRRTRRVRSAVQAPDARRSAPRRRRRRRRSPGSTRTPRAPRARTTTRFPWTSTARRTTPWAGRWRGACAGPTYRTWKTCRTTNPCTSWCLAPARGARGCTRCRSARRRTCPWTSSWRSPRRTTRRGTARCWRRRWAACRWWSRRGRRT
jgi:hypothetical protein